MRPTATSGLGLALAWFAFPLVPAILGMTHHQRLNWGFGQRGGPDPREWGWLTWIILTGPLFGYGFLAGATIDLPDAPGLRGPRSWLARRATWVAIGPWVGFLGWGTLHLLALLVIWAYPPSRDWSWPSLPATWWANGLMWVVLGLFVVGPLAFGWLVVAWAALRRARRLDRLRRSLASGLALSVGFVGSLIGSFWAITAAWRDYFFDPRIMPVLVAATTLVLASGCANTETYGEVRRRELFQAMLMAWLLGLALAWRWWSRSRPRPPS